MQAYLFLVYDTRWTDTFHCGAEREQGFYLFLRNVIWHDDG